MRLTPDYKSHGSRRQRILGRKIRRGYLTLPLSVVKVEGRRSNPEAAVTATFVRINPFVLFEVNADGLWTEIKGN